MKQMRHQLLVAAFMHTAKMDRPAAELAANMVVQPQRKSGFYETIYGNTARYHAGSKSAYDLDSAEKIPAYLLDKWLRPL